MLSITKEQLQELPEVKYPGRVILIDSAAKARSALAYLNRVDQVGFDTETRPSFHKYRHYTVSLVQVSVLDECFLFRLKQMGGLEGMMRFLQNPSVQKIGLSLKDDFHSLSKLLGEFSPQGFVELQSYVKPWGIADNSLQRIYGIIFNERISKGQRLTNWEAPELTESQQQYAAIDAWACQRIYNHLTAGLFNPEMCPYHPEEAEMVQHAAHIS